MQIDIPKNFIDFILYINLNDFTLTQIVATFYVT